MSSEPNSSAPRALRWSDLLKALLLPPAGLFWPAFLGLGLVAGGFDGPGLALVGVSLAVLYLFSVPAVGGWLISRLNQLPPFESDLAASEIPTALVVLDAGRRLGADEYGGDGLRSMTLERLAYAAWLWRRLKLPILVTGNGAGALMATYLKELFDVPVRWVEPTSHNTYENAERTAEMLRAEAIERLILVTHYWHMPRAMTAFSRTGLVVVPAPMDFTRHRGSWERGWLLWVPSVQGALRSHLAIHEIVGLLWYRLRYDKLHQ